VRHGSVTLLFMALNYLQERLINSIQYAWNAKGEDILNAIQRAREAMASPTNG
jgi:hypothetical protein